MFPYIPTLTGHLSFTVTFHYKNSATVLTEAWLPWWKRSTCMTFIRLLVPVPPRLRGSSAPSRPGSLGSSLLALCVHLPAEHMPVEAARVQVTHRIVSFWPRDCAHHPAVALQYAQKAISFFSNFISNMMKNFALGSYSRSNFHWYHQWGAWDNFGECRGCLRTWLKYPRSVTGSKGKSLLCQYKWTLRCVHT